MALCSAKALRVGATIFGLIALAPFFSSMAIAQSTLDTIKQRGKILLGVKTDYPPFAYLDKDQKYVGFDVDLWKEFAKQLGVTIEYVPITSQSRIPLLINGAIDVVSGGTTHTIGREATVDYSITYFRTGQRLLVRKGSGIKGAADLSEPKSVAVVQGANSGPNFQKIQPRAKIVSFQEYPQAVLALKQGKVDALTTDEVILDQFADEQLEVVGELITVELYGMLMRENDSKWRDWINIAIQKTWKDGTYRAFHRQHFKREPTYEIEIWQD